MPLAAAVVVSAKFFASIRARQAQDVALQQTSCLVAKAVWKYMTWQLQTGGQHCTYHIVHTTLYVPHTKSVLATSTTTYSAIEESAQKALRLYQNTALPAFTQARDISDKGTRSRLWCMGHREDALSDHRSVGGLTWGPLTGSLNCPAGRTFQK